MKTVGTIIAALLFVCVSMAIAQTPSVPMGSINGVTAGAGLGGGGTIGNVIVSSSITINRQLGTSYTVLASDQAKLVTFANISAVAVTLPTAGSTGFSAGYSVILSNYGPGLATITPVSGTIGLFTSIQLQGGFGIQVVSDGGNWQITGNMSTFGFPTTGGNNIFTGNNQFTGGVEVGSPSSGMPSAGNLNAQGLQVNGVSVLTGNQTVTLSGDTTGSGTTAITTTTGRVNGVSYPSSPSSGTIPSVTSSASSGTVTYSATPTLGIGGTTKGTLTLSGNSSGTVTIAPQAAAGNWTITLPSSGGSASQFLQTDGTGNTSWVSAAGTGTVNSGTAGQIAWYASTGTTVSGNANASMGTVSSGTLTIGRSGIVGGTLALAGASSQTVSIQSSTTAGNWTLTLPTSAGSSGQSLFTNGSGITSWGGGSGPTLISTFTCSTSAAATFTGISGYNEIQLRLRGLVAGTNGVDIILRVGNGSYDTGANYGSALLATVTGTPRTASGATSIVLNGAPGEIPNTAGFGFGSTVNIKNVLSTTVHKTVEIFSSYITAGPVSSGATGSGAWINAATTINQVEVLFSTGTCAAGTVELWGIP